MRREGACPCGAVRFAVDGPVRDVIVCHCDACREATGGPWAASAAHRPDLAIHDETALNWEPATVSEAAASRGRCRTCGTTVFWDAPGRDTVSFAVAALVDSSGLDVAAHIWVDDLDRATLGSTGVPAYRRGMPASPATLWRT